MPTRLTTIKFSLLATLLLAVVFSGASFAVAQPNAQINYQGKLTDASGVAVADGTYNMRFWLLQSTSQATTSAVWTESLTSTDQVQVTNGLFSVMLGSTSALTAVDFNQTLYLGVEIGGTGGSPTWDGEMSPRKPLGTVPAAFESFKLGGVASSSFLRSDAADTASGLVTFTGGLLSSASSTIAGLSFDTATGTRLVLGSDTVTDFTGTGLVNTGGALSVSSSSLNLDLEGLIDVTAMTENLGDLLYWNGSAWADIATATLKVAISDTTGTLAATRGGTGLSTVTQNQLLIGGAGDTWTQIATSSLGLGNGTFLGLSDTPSSYTTAAIPFVSGSALAFDSEFIYDGTNLGLGTASPGAMLDIFGTSNGLRLSYDGSNYSELSVNASGDLTISSGGGTGSVMTLGSGLAEDLAFLLDGSGADWYAGLDDTDDLFKIGTGTEVGTSTLFQISSATSTFNTVLTVNHNLTATGSVTFSSLTGGLLTTNSAGLLSTTTVASSSLAASNWTNGRILQASTTATGGFDWVATTTLGITTTDDDLTNNSIEDLSDVAAMTENYGDLLYWNGSAWADIATTSLGLGNGTFLGLSDTPSSYTANRVMYTDSGGTALTDSANFVFDGTKLGIGSTTPSATLSVAGNTWLDSNVISFASSSASTLLLRYFTEATSTIKDNSAFAFTIATSTTDSPIFRIDTSGTYANTLVDGSFTVNNGAISYDAATDQTTIENLALGNMTFGDDAGIVSWADMGITGSAATSTVMSYSAQLDGNSLLTIYGEADGQGGLDNSSIGIGTTTPWARLAVAGDAGDAAKPLFTVASSTGSSLFHITYDGKVGVGTTSPTTKFSVSGDTYLGGTLTNTGTVTFSSLTGGLLTTNSAGLLSTTTVASSSLAASNWTNGRILQASTTATGGFDWVATTTLGITTTDDDLTNNSIEDLSDVAAMTENYGDLLYWNGSAWADIATTSLGLGNGTFLGLSDTPSSYTANRVMYTNSGGTALTDSANFVFDGTKLGIGTTSPNAKLSLQTTGFSGDGVMGFDQYLQTTNSVNAAVQYGDRFFIDATSTATTTLVGSMFRIDDDTIFGNTVRGLEVQANRGGNTQGENTALSGFARTFGVRGFTSGDAGAVYEPAGGFFETGGTTQGNAMRGYSSSITTASLLALFQDTSDFEGTGLQMNFGNTTGSFSSSTSKYLDFQNAGVSVFSVSAFGTTTIGDGTTGNMAGLQIGYGGLCVDNDGSCTASTTGRISAVSYYTGNSDLAEMYFSSAELEPGEVVVLSGDLSIDRATQESDMPVFGVVSTKPGLTLGFDDTSLDSEQTGYPIALSGRVPIKLSNENGPIKRGDELMLSSVPGVAMKATGVGATIGIALEDFNENRRYSDTYLNQFGDDMVEPQYEPIFTNFDLRIHDGCYYGGGGMVGETSCVPLIATTSDGQVAEANVIAEQESIEEQLAALHASTSQTETLASGREVQVGQIVMFVDKSYRWLDAPQAAALGVLTGTSSVQMVGDNVTETIFDRLVALANRFVDGVLSVLTLRAERVETNELCVDDVCVNADALRQILQDTNANQGEEGEDTGVDQEGSETTEENDPAPTPEPTIEDETVTEAIEPTEPDPTTEEVVEDESSVEQGNGGTIVPEEATDPIPEPEETVPTGEGPESPAQATEPE